MFRRHQHKPAPDRATFRNVVFEREGDLIAFSGRAIQSALTHNVSPAVYFDDLIFSSLYVVGSGNNLDNAAEMYFTSGRTSAEREEILPLCIIVTKWKMEFFERKAKLLDFASGYGCMGCGTYGT